MRITSILSAVLMFLASPAIHADDSLGKALETLTPPPGEGEPDMGFALSPLKIGKTAPFTGVLLTPKATAKIVAQLKLQPEFTQLEVDKATKLADAQCTYKLQLADAQTKFDTSVLKAQLDSRDSQIKLLDQQLARAQSAVPRTVLWSSLSFIGGSALTVLTTIAVSYGMHSAVNTQ